MKHTKLISAVLLMAVLITSFAACSMPKKAPPTKEAFKKASTTQKLSVNDGIQLVGTQNLKATISSENKDDSFVALYVQASNTHDALTVYNNQTTTCLSCTGMSSPSATVDRDDVKISEMKSDKGYACVYLNNDTVIVVLTKPNYEQAAKDMLDELHIKATDKT